MLSLRYPPAVVPTSLKLTDISKRFNEYLACGLKGPRPRYPCVWKSRKRIGTISKSAKLVERVVFLELNPRPPILKIKGLSNVKEEVYGALDAFVAWDLEFPLITVKKALKTLTDEKEWKRVVQVTKWMLSKGQAKTMRSYYTLLNALTEDGRLEEAEALWAMIFSKHLEHLPREHFCKMISIYYSSRMHEKMFEVFADMEELGVKPNGPIVEMLGNVFQELGMMDKYEKLMKKFPPPVWEYQCIRGKRIRVRAKHPNEADELTHAQLPDSLHLNLACDKDDVEVSDLEHPHRLDEGSDSEDSESEDSAQVDTETSIQAPQSVHEE